MHRKLGLLSLVVGLLLGIQGCAGTKFKFSDARLIRIGMTEQEVVQLMGSPYMVTAKPDGQVWVWSYADGMTGQSRAVSIVMRDGKVVALPSIPESFK